MPYAISASPDSKSSLSQISTSQILNYIKRSEMTYLPQKKLGMNATVMCEFWGENSFSHKSLALMVSTMAFNVTLCTHWLGWIYWFSFLINWKSETPWFERIFGFFGHGLVDSMSVSQINGLSICLSVRSFVRTTELMEISFSDCQSRGKLLQCSSLYAS